MNGDAGRGRGFPMSFSANIFRTPGPVIALASMLMIACRRELPPSEYMAEYEKQTLSESNSAGYQFSILPLTADYLSAQHADSTWSPVALESFRKSYSGFTYISLRISPSNPSGEDSDFKKDYLGAGMVAGQEAYQQRLHLLQYGLAPYAFLEFSDGTLVSPLSYRFERGYGLAGAESFLFMFPKSKNGRDLSLPGSRFILKDFGLNTGTVKIPIRTGASLALKV